jgi:hypothetical protein
MRPLLACPLFIGLAACPNEYEMAPQWEPSLLDQFECDGTADAEAAPEERPVAVCEASQLSLGPIHESADFFGRDSYDPLGGVITGYQWTLVEAPAGSAVALAGTRDADIYGFSPDLVGRYTAELVVVNDACVVSEPCLVTIEAIPDEDLWVELTWEHPGDDMDLHVLQGNAAPESNGDCYYGNCVAGGLDWGSAGESSDDPRLDLDDIPGTGPENINLFDPANGVFHVAVHDYPGSVYNGDNDVTVRVFVAGEKVYEDTKTIRGEDRFLPFADVDWPSGEITRR